MCNAILQLLMKITCEWPRQCSEPPQRLGSTPGKSCRHSPGNLNSIFASMFYVICCLKRKTKALPQRYWWLHAVWKTLGRRTLREVDSWCCRRSHHCACVITIYYYHYYHHYYHFDVVIVVVVIVIIIIIIMKLAVVAVEYHAIVPDFKYRFKFWQICEICKYRYFWRSRNCVCSLVCLFGDNGYG